MRGFLYGGVTVMLRASASIGVPVNLVRRDHLMQRPVVFVANATNGYDYPIFDISLSLDNLI